MDDIITRIEQRMRGFKLDSGPDPRRIRPWVAATNTIVINYSTATLYADYSPQKIEQLAHTIIGFRFPNEDDRGAHNQRAVLFTSDSTLR